MNTFLFLLLAFSTLPLVCMEAPPGKMPRLQNKPTPILVLQIIQPSIPITPAISQSPNIIQKDKTRPAQDNPILAIDRGDLDAVNSFLARIHVNCPFLELEWDADRFGLIKVTRVETSNNTLLMFAASKGKIEIVKRLLALGADPNLQNDQKHTALTLCNKYTNVMRVLLERKANPNIKVFCGNTALIYAIMKQDKAHTQLLLEFGANATIKNDYGFSAEWYAQATGKEYVELIRLFTAQTVASEQMSEIVVDNKCKSEISDEC